MHSFRILEHTADVGFEAFGETRPQLFANAARALTSLRVDLDSVAALEPVKLRVQGPDLPGLLVNWLSEILYLEDAEEWLFSSFDFSAFEETSLDGVARGERFSPARHRLKSLVKAVTYHQLAVEKKDGVWRARVFVDV
ncbi:MAG TPA: archease [Terriglobia bacterium]|nr:archease [Terriglobia bacterium]